MSMNQSNNQIIKKNLLIICRGAGDLATGIIHRLHRAGHRVIALETDYPAAIRRQVSFCEAVYDGSAVVEGVTARLVPALADAETDTETYSGINDTPAAHIVSEKWDSSAIEAVLEAGEVPLLIDQKGESIALLKPDVVVDAIIAKKNLGTTIDMAPLVIGVGPGFTAGQDVHLVIESMRGHNLARIITDGMAQPNTGVPGNIAGFTSERVIHAPAAGYIHDVRKIGDIVQKGDEIARIYPDKESYDNALSEYVPVNATITGIIRGLIREGYYFRKGFKIADIDPRESEITNCFTISDKARSIAGSVLEAVSAFEHGVKIY
ncbi:selenium-dependent molybdenum cofactor biosynthesis protein YqeB [Agathobacter rectalis]|jgi:xanthine dehydrogenase accessory factor|uniref:EF2563 family selenium-dependent molybdenum hydroxylase system protein n=1 Tax=Agathobacter rectalis TaxID=39491 RepID=A0A5S4VT24_9FIRM|nr:selenium-dependent molybdenum cofactor biosynthesis protein YqeB [Agathobacter rectalis]TYL60792.1 EF2563 family selenium-dependent molybdenum hydroxylase system protein [Agathobacter rectalis]